MDFDRILDMIRNPPPPHPCERAGCPHTIDFDDEPFCFEHSPNSGSAMAGYSWLAKHGPS